MKEITALDARWSIERSGTWLSLRLTSESDARTAAEMFLDGKPRTVEIKRKYNKRSKDANDLLWELCTQISETLSRDGLIVSKEEIYRKHIKHSGKCTFLAGLEKDMEAFDREWCAKGIGWFTERVDDCKIPGCVKICVYYGSSSYDTKEMSRLIDSVIQEAKDIGIEVLSERELQLIKDDWNAPKQ